MSDHEPTVSVLLPAYNAADAIDRAIESILAQTFQDFELLVLDDGSSDTTVEQARRYEDPRIKIIELEHSGLPGTLNRGIELARAPLLARQDADDWSEPERLAMQVELFDADPELDLVASWWATVDDDGNHIGTSELPEASDDLKSLLRIYNPFGHGSMMMKKESVKALGGYDENLRFAQDYDLWLRMAQADMRFACVQKMLYSYSITPESVARGYQKLVFSDALRRRAYSGDNSEIVIGDLPRLSERRIRSIYEYTVGSLRLEDGHRLAASKALLRAISINPAEWRAYAKLLLTPAPNSLRRGLITRFRRRHSS